MPQPLIPRRSLHRNAPEERADRRPVERLVRLRAMEEINREERRAIDRTAALIYARWACTVGRRAEPPKVLEGMARDAYMYAETLMHARSDFFSKVAAPARE